MTESLNALRATNGRAEGDTIFKCLKRFSFNRFNSESTKTFYIQYYLW